MLSLRDPNHPLSRPYLLIVTAIPAVVFAVMWWWLNSNFLPFFGVGNSSISSSELVGAVAWWWNYRGLQKAQKGNEPEILAKQHNHKVYWNLAAAVVSVPFGRMIFTMIPPWNDAIGAYIGLLLGHISINVAFANSNKNRFVHDRGTVLISTEEALLKIKSRPIGKESKIKWAGFELPGEIAEGNFMVVGAIGTGKTRMHRELMASVLPNIRPGQDCRVIVYDVKSDLLSELSEMRPNSEVMVLNPFDKRSVAWDLLADIKTPNDASNFANSLIPPDNRDENAFFTTGARNIIASVINRLNVTHPGDWDLRRLIRITAKRERMEKLLEGSDRISQYFSPEKTFANIQNTIANVMVPLEPVAALWQRTQRKISLKEWVKKGDSILVLGGREDLQASLEHINRAALKMASSDFSVEDESALRSRLWFFCDELKFAGRLDSLPILLNSRSKGVRCVLGFQDMEGLVRRYGSIEAVREILSGCKNISWLRLTSSDTAKWASERSGELERFEYLETRTKDQQDKSVGEHLAKREAILPSEFLNLPDFVSGDADGFHLIMGAGGVFRSIAHYEFPKKSVPNFDPRPAADQILADWNDADDEWLDGGETDTEPEPPVKPKPSTGTSVPVGRVRFPKKPDERK